MNWNTCVTISAITNKNLYFVKCTFTLQTYFYQVRVGSTLSEKFDQAQGVSQGSILSTTLFNIKINSIMDCVDPKTDGSLYVDDFCMCYRSKSMRKALHSTYQVLKSQMPESIELTESIITHRLVALFFFSYTVPSFVQN